MIAKQSISVECTSRDSSDSKGHVRSSGDTSYSTSVLDSFFGFVYEYQRIEGVAPLPVPHGGGAWTFMGTVSTKRELCCLSRNAEQLKRVPFWLQRSLLSVEIAFPRSKSSPPRRAGARASPFRLSNPEFTLFNPHRYHRRSM